MTPNLENFRPKLRPGRVIPQGSRIIFETDDPYNQIVLPTAVADLVLLCSGQFSVREIIEKIYKKQGAVPFKSILAAIHVLHEGGFFENGEQLVLSSHLRSWMSPRRSRWSLSWRFGQRIMAESRSPLIYYSVTLLVLIGSILGLQFVPSDPLPAAARWAFAQSPWSGLLKIFICSSILQSVRYLVCIWQLLLLTSKAYNVSLRLSPWGLHLYVGDEANDLFENRLYTSMFHVSQIFVSWLVVLIASSFVKVDLIEPLIIVGALMMFWELNPFIHSEGRKLIRALLLPSDRDAVSWHFEGNALINSINPEAVRQDRDFARICAIWGGVWLTVALAGLHQLAISFGPVVFRHLMHFSQASLISAFGLLAWLAGLYYIVQSFVETILAALVRPYWGAVKARFRRMSIVPNSDWPLASVVKSIESLPLFSHFHEQYLEKIADQSEVLRYPARTTILQQGKAARELFVLLEGEVEVMRRGPLGDVVWVTKLAPVSVFGEAALVDDTPRAAQVITKTAATVLRVPVSVLRQAALEAQSVRQLEVFRNAILVNQFFTSSPVFRSLSSSSIDFLCSRGTLEYFDQNQKVFEQGDAGDSLYLILRGTVQVEIHGTAIKHLNQGSFFGEIALIADIPRTATIVTLEPCAFFKISADSFWEILVQHMDLGVFIESISEARLREDLALAAPPPATGTDS